MIGRLILLCFVVAAGCLGMAAVVSAGHGLVWVMFAGYAVAAGVLIAAARWVFAGWAQ